MNEEEMRAKAVDRVSFARSEAIMLLGPAGFRGVDSNDFERHEIISRVAGQILNELQPTWEMGGPKPSGLANLPDTVQSLPG